MHAEVATDQCRCRVLRIHARPQDHQLVGRQPELDKEVVEPMRKLVPGLGKSRQQGWHRAVLARPGGREAIYGASDDFVVSKVERMRDVFTATYFVEPATAATAPVSGDR
jgi:hypothetical protein